MNVYLDNCCYSRLFDDRSNIKNYLEREAVLIIMQKAFEGEFHIIGSDILEIEISKMPDYEKQRNIEAVYNVLVSDNVGINDIIKQRAIDIREASNIKAFDSLHLACSETRADVLITTDNKFLRNCQKLDLRIVVKNPIDYVMEVFRYDSDY